jgi:hypothetical protein
VAPSRRDQLRAGLIAVVLLLQLLDAVPLPELRAKHLANPVAKAELKQWSEVLHAVGVTVTPTELGEIGLRMGSVAGTFRKTALRPWHPFRQLTGTGQSWGLFAYPEPATGRLVLDGRSAVGTETFYRAPGGKNDALESVLEYRRIRGVYDGASDRPQPRRIYRRFGVWVASRIMRVRPDITDVEVRLDLHPVRTPDQGRSVADKRRHARQYSRAALERDGLLEPRP